MRQLNYLWLLLILIAGCASIAKPQSFDQQLAYVQSGITSAKQTAFDLLQRDRITPEKALEIDAEANKARAALSVARGVGNTPAGQDSLAVAVSILVSIEAQLKEAQ